MVFIFAPSWEEGQCAVRTKEFNESDGSITYMDKAIEKQAEEMNHRVQADIPI